MLTEDWPAQFWVMALKSEQTAVLRQD